MLCGWMPYSGNLVAGWILVFLLLDRLEGVKLRSNTSQEDIAKVLGEPGGFDLSDAASKIRRNLLLASSVVLVLILGGIEPSPNLSIFGVAFEGVTSFKLMIGLSLVLGYNFLHYMWYCFEIYSEWAIRITGTKLAFVTGAKVGASGEDYPEDPKQSTLYGWWLHESRSMPAYDDLVLKVDRSVKELEEHVKQWQAAGFIKAHEIDPSIAGLNNNLMLMSQACYYLGGVITNNRIPVSLARFDNRFKLLLRSQNIRIALIEVGFPIALSLTAAGYLIRFFWVH